MIFRDFTCSLGGLGSLGAPFFLNSAPDQLYVFYIQKRNGAWNSIAFLSCRGGRKNGIILGVLFSIMEPP